MNGTTLAVENFKKKYPKYTFIRISINNWKNKIQRDKNDPGSSTLQERRGRPNLLPDELMLKVKDVITGARLTGGDISRKTVMAIGNGVVKANYPSKLKEFRGHIVLTEGWARNVLKSMAWSKRKGTTGKIEPSEQFLLEEKLTFQRQISSYQLPRHSEGSYRKLGPNTVILCMSWKIHFQSKSGKDYSNQRHR